MITKLRLSFMLLSVLALNRSVAQVPTISYPSPQTFVQGTTITPLAPTSTLVASPAYSSNITTFASGFNSPEGMAVDAAGNVYVADEANSLVKKIPAGGGTPVSIGTGFLNPRAVAVDAVGNVYVGDDGNNVLKEIRASDGSTITFPLSLSSVTGVAVDLSENIYLAEGYLDVSEIPSGTTALEGIGIGSYGTGVNGIVGVSVDAIGNIYVAFSGNSVREIPVGGGTVIIYNSGLISPKGIAVDCSGNVFVTDIGDGTVKEIPFGSSDAITIGSGFGSPSGVAVDGAGNVYVADASNNVIKQIKPVGGYYIKPFLPGGLKFNTTTGVISGTPVLPGQAVNYNITAYNSSGSKTTSLSIAVKSAPSPTIHYTSPHIYNQGSTISPLAPSSTLVSAPTYSSTPVNKAWNLINPFGLAIDITGNVYVSESNGDVKKIPVAGGAPIVIGSGFIEPEGIAVDKQDNVYVADYGNNVVQEIQATSGTKVTLTTSVAKPEWLAIDVSGNLYILNTDSVYRMPVGSHTPIAIGGGYSQPSGLAVDARGNVYVTDTGYGVFEIPSGGGQQIPIAVVVTPSSVAVDAAGNLYVGRGNGTLDEILAVSKNVVSINPMIGAISGVAVDVAGDLYISGSNGLITESKPTGGFFINTALPAGLTFDSETGTIAGTPTVSSPSRNYTIAGYNNVGASATANLNLEVTTNDNLSNLTLSNGTLSPVFSSATTNYSTNVGYGLTTMTVTPTASDPAATITVNGATVPSGTASSHIPLVVGANVVPIVVTSKDGLASKTYSLTINEAQSSNSNLAGLALSNGTLSPAFATITTSYTASEPNITSFITVTPTLADPNATVQVNGTAVLSGKASHAIALSVGPNTITIVVTAQNGTTTKTYTITVTRIGASNANLTAIGPSITPLNPSFTSSMTNYTINAPNTAATITVKPVTGDPNATIKVNGTSVTSGTVSQPIALAEGTTTPINLVVTAQDGATTKTYTITVTRAPSIDPTLSNISLNNGTLVPAFAPGKTSYTAGVLNTVSNLKLTPTSTDGNATIKVNGTIVASGTASGAIALNVGTNIITTVVTAQNGTTTKTYTITVTRALSSDASLSNILLSAGTLSPVFAKTSTSYTVSVPNTTTSITLTPTTTNGNATMKVNGTAVSSGTPSGQITLNVGQNTISILVSAQDGATTKTYTISVTRVPSINASLASMSPSVTPLSPIFAPATTSYTLAVKNSITSMTVKPVTSDANATIKVNGATVVSGTTSQAIALAVGSNNISVVVTAQDGTTTRTYTITVTRAAGPVANFDDAISVTKPTETATLAEDGILVHQGISPNGDGINDFLQIENINQYPDNKLTIMNRNGQMIYEAKNYGNSTKVFDGHSNKNGQMQLPGTYFYQLDYTVKGVVKHKTGFIVLKY